MNRSSDRAQRRALWTARQSSGRAQHNAGITPRSQRIASPVAPSRARGKIFRITLAVLLALTIGGGVFGYKIIAASDSISDAERSILGQIKDLLFTSGRTLHGEEDDRVNILLIAVGGAGHNGEELADTIMIASFKPASNEAALLSIPRDLFVQVPGEEFYAKINSVHSFGQAKPGGQGPQLLEQSIEEITGLPIHYYVRVDFTAFKGIVDAVGGVNINIEKSFYDYWHKISFPAGTEKMNGERALAYVRARYIEGPEGGDFKRAARQQQVLLAIREKVFSVQTAIDFTRISSILDSLAGNIRTDMELWEMRRFYELGRAIDPSQVNSAVLDTGPAGVLTGGTEILSGAPASILKPRTGDYSEIHAIARDLFTVDQASNQSAVPSAAPEATPASTPEITPPPAEKPSLDIRNGTNITGLAGSTRDQLESAGYEVTSIGNAAARDLTQTVIYPISVSADAVSDLAATLSADIGQTLPESETASNAAVVIILGADAQ